MKFSLALGLTAVLGFACSLYFPWWSVAIAAFVGSVLVEQSPLRSFGSGFAALFLVWGIHAFVIDIMNEQLLSGRIAHLLNLGHPFFVWIITAIVGGLLGGMGALTGSYVRVTFPSNKNA